MKVVTLAIVAMGIALAFICFSLLALATRPADKVYPVATTPPEKVLTYEEHYRVRSERSSRGAE